MMKSERRPKVCSTICQSGAYVRHICIHMYLPVCVCVSSPGTHIIGSIPFSI